jgi:hypothetical protein
VLDAPFTADAITTVRLTVQDGTHLNQTTTAHYYRDSAGHVRVELVMNGLDPPHTSAERHIRTILDPDLVNAPRHGEGGELGGVFTLDAGTRTARYFPRFAAEYMAGGRGSFGVPIGGVRFLTLRRPQDVLSRNEGNAERDTVDEESLGDRRIDGLDTTGHRLTLTLPVAGSNKPIEVVDERWESADLKVLIAAHTSDTRWGKVEYELTNIRRVEPPAELFVVPADYTIDYSSVGHNPWLTLIPGERYPAEKRSERGP